MNQPMQLSLEQQFQLRSFADQTKLLSREQAQELLIKLHQQMLHKENFYKHFLKHQWGLDSNPSSA
ncbi:NblA/ycf18 family protein [Lyngbya aestuarii]|uniref:NblA/ycf18 family protein n=1 Tax=Lyngbya aestuarii TaxID=118322 RepID=UPI00403DC928